jgi:hypothetical protein
VLPSGAAASDQGLLDIVYALLVVLVLSLASDATAGEGYVVFEEAKLPTCKEWGGRCIPRDHFCDPDTERDGKGELGLSCEPASKAESGAAFRPREDCCLPVKAPYVTTKKGEALVRRRVERERAEAALPECTDLGGVCRHAPASLPYFIREYCVPQKDGTCVEPPPPTPAPTCPQGMREVKTRKIVGSSWVPANVKPCKLPISRTPHGAFRLPGVCCVPDRRSEP